MKEGSEPLDEGPWKHLAEKGTFASKSEEEQEGAAWRLQ